MADEQLFPIGKVVYCRQYEVEMTVEEIFADGENSIGCCWWDGSRFLRARFMPSELSFDR